MLVTRLLLLTPMQLGQILQTTRKARKLSQTALALRLGLSQSRVSYLEQHPGDLNMDQLLAWCAVLELELTLGARDTAQDAAPGADW